jgi:hypothetical protein
VGVDDLLDDDPVTGVWRTLEQRTGNQGEAGISLIASKAGGGGAAAEAAKLGKNLVQPRLAPVARKSCCE